MQRAQPFPAMVATFAAAAVVLLVACGRGQEDAPVGEKTAGRDTTAAGGAASEAAAADTGIAMGQPLVIADVGFGTPESAQYDEAADVYLVSNINGDVFAKDDNGFVSQVSPDGKVLELRWIDGADENVTLHSPKGIAVKGDSLLVADLDSVRVFNRTTGEPGGVIGVPGAVFLNDVAVGPDGVIYVTDTAIKPAGEGFESTGADAVYRIEPDGRVAPLAKGKELGGPNGVFADDKGLIVVSFGTGKAYTIDLPSGERRDVEGIPAGMLDGVIRFPDGSLLVSSWEGKGVYHITPAGEAHHIVDDEPSPGDIGYDARRNRLLLPSLQGNKVAIHQLH